MHCLPNPRTRFKVPLSGVAERRILFVFSLLFVIPAVAVGAAGGERVLAHEIRRAARVAHRVVEMAQRGRQIVEPQHLHQRADAAGREARLVAAAVLVLEKVHVPRIGVAVARAQLRRRLHALDVLGRELFLSARAAESLHRRRHHRRGVVVRQRFDVRPLRHAQDKRGEHRAVDDVHFEAVALVKFRQLRDDLAIFLFGTRRNVLRLLRGQVEFDRQVLFKRSGKQRPHARRLSKILHLLSPFRV